MPSSPSQRFTGPVFLVGMPRSGTKLLREILLRNSQLKIPRLETDFFPQLAQYVASRAGSLQSEEEFGRMYEWIQRFAYFKYAQRLGKVIGQKEWYGLCATFTPAGIFEALLRDDVGVPAGSMLVWGDKSPSYVTCIALLAEHFPAARFIHIVRDVRDQVLSMRRIWGKDVLRGAQRWTDDVELALDQAESLGDRCILVRYEDLVRDPEQLVTRVCDFLDLEFHESMLTLDRPAEKAGVARGQKSIVMGNSNKFLSGFNDRELAGIESIAGSVMRRLGYVPVKERKPMRLSGVSMQLRKIRDGISLVRSRSSIAGWDLLGAIRFYLRLH